MKGPNPAPLQPSVYTHYGVDRRSLAHPDFPDRRTIQPSDLVDRCAIPPPEHLDRRPMPPSDLVDRRGIPPPDHLERRGVLPPDLVDRRAVPPPDHLERRVVPPPDLVDRRAILLPDYLERRGVLPPDLVDRRTIPPHDHLERRGVPPPDLVDRRLIPPPDHVDRRGIPVPDLVDRRGIPPPDLVDRCGIPVPDLDRRALPPPDDLDRRAIPPPELIDRRMVAAPDGLERRTIALSDGSIRTYFALPPDPPPFARAYHVLDQLPQPISLSQPQTSLTLSPNQERSDKAPDRENESLAQGQSTPNNSKSDRDSEKSGAGPSAPKRKHEQEEARSSKREKTGSKEKEKDKGDKGKGPSEVDEKALLDAFLKMSKLVNESLSQKRNYLSEGMHRPIRCIVCESYERESKVKDFVDVNALLMHAYNAIKHPGLLVKHRALHKALCVLMGWDSSVEPTNSKGYQRLSPDEAQANKDDLILWPPMVVIQNTNSSTKKDGRLEGMGNKEMDAKILDLGFTGAKSKSLYGREGHQGVTIVRFAETLAGLKEAERLSQLFKKSGQGRKNWIEVQMAKDNNKSSELDTNTSHKNPNLVKEFGSGERRVLYGYLATASDLEILDSDVKKRAVVRSRRESEFPDK